MRRARWSAVEGGEVVGTATGLMRPDGRWFISIDAKQEAVFAGLLDAIKVDLRQPLHVNVDAGSEQERDRWRSAGFGIARREYEYELSTDLALAQLRAAALPDGFVLVAADRVDEAELRDLDDTLRQDVPGTDGWYNDPKEFHDYTFDARHFDASTYLVALDELAQTSAGLVRVWMDAGHPRLGLIGVRDGYRRIGLARAMLATVFARLEHLGIRSVAAEADSTNAASNSLLTSIGGHRAGETLELFLDTTQH